MLSLTYIDSCPKGLEVLEKDVVSPALKNKRSSCNDGSFKNSCINDRSSDNTDDSLLSLQWLQRLSSCTPSQRRDIYTIQNQSILFDQQLGGKAPTSPLAVDLATIGMPLTPGKPTATAVPALSHLPSLIAHGHCQDEVDYQTNPHVRPPYPYATLICMAMQANKNSKNTLSYIYKWITDNFCYFRYTDPTWQNSIRHTLSTNKCFVKVPRQKNEPGKGGFWKIDPEYAERLLTGAYKKQMMPPVQINPAFKYLLKNTSEPVMTVPTNARSVLNVGPEEQKLLQEFEEITGLDQNCDPSLADTTSLDCWSAVKSRKRKRQCSHQTEGVMDRCCSSSSLLATDEPITGLGQNCDPCLADTTSFDCWNSVKSQKRKRQNSLTGGAMTLCCSNSPQLATEEPKVLESFKDNFDWGALLNSALNGDLNLNEDGFLSPLSQNQDLMAHDINDGSLYAFANSAEDNDIDFDKETYLATEFLQNPWTETEQRNDSDFFCTSTTNINQLFDLGDSLDVDINSRIQFF